LRLSTHALYHSLSHRDSSLYVARRGPAAGRPCVVDDVDSVGDDDEEQPDVTNINRKAKMNKQVDTLTVQHHCARHLHVAHLYST